MRLDPDLLTRKLRDLGDLTPRQCELIRLTLMGETLAQVAMRLGISIRTAKMHRHDAFERLGVRSTGEMWSLLFSMAGHDLDAIKKHGVRWTELFKRMGDPIYVDRVMRITGRTRAVVVRQLEAHGYDVD